MSGKTFSDGLTACDLLVVVDSEVRHHGLGGHHIRGYNGFVSTGMKQIITKLFKAERTIVNERKQRAEDQQIANISFSVEFTKVETSRPTMIKRSNSRTEMLLPATSRTNMLNYSGPVTVDATITAKAFGHDGAVIDTRKESVRDVRITNIPTMVRSETCHTFGDSYEQLVRKREDPFDEGGNFVLHGNEWIANTMESRPFNHAHVFRNVGHGKDICRLEFLSKPGDAYENSSEIIMRLVTDGNIYIRLTSDTTGLALSEIPFYIIFRILGMTTDQEIVDNIVYGHDQPSPDGRKDVVNYYMLQTLQRAFRAPDKAYSRAQYTTDHADLLHSLSTELTTLARAGNISTKDEPPEVTTARFASLILRSFDKYLLPHIGLGPESRHRKLRYLGHLIHKLLLTHMKIVPQTDRDSLKNKRFHTAGRSLAKTFKRDFNSTVIQAVKKAYSKAFKMTSFANVQLATVFNTSVKANDLEKAITQAIITGNKEITIRNRQQPNRLASEMLHRKNQLNVIASLRTIRVPVTSSAKQDQRADEMRRAHPSYTGFIDPIQSADTGVQVGMVKQMSLASSFSEATSNELLKQTLLKDPDIIPWERVFPSQIHKHNLTKILVNGDIIGCCQSAPAIVRRYREVRRGFQLKYSRGERQEGVPLIDQECTIYWDTDSNEISFWVDHSRFLRPLLIVRNNGEQDPIGAHMFGTHYDAKRDPPAPQPGCWTQDILLTKADIADMMAGRLTSRDLHRQGRIDLISPDEMENLYIASSLDQLHRDRHNSLKQYTHCEIPAGLMGLPTLTCPFAGHNQCPRICFQTNQSKQTGGWYALNYPYREDKLGFLQYYCEAPICSTMANRYLYPNGANAWVATMSYGGHNQEDSITGNKSAEERGLHLGVHFDVIKAELETDKNEHFGLPNEALTTDIKKHADYSKLNARGVPNIGTKLKKDDVVIGRYVELPKPEDRRTYKDTSLLYSRSEPALVDNTILDARNEDGNPIIKVKTSSVRVLGVGDKFSSRAGQKGLTGATFTQANMPFTSGGLVPDLIMNPHAIPSRMTIGQPIEGGYSKLGAHRGCTYDATIFRPIDPDSVGTQLQELGYDYYGREAMYSGFDGERIDALIFFTPIYYQRLQKFVADEVYAISTGPTCIVTRQPLEGKANKGGLRIGEMEQCVIISHGEGHFLMEKFRDDSDGFDIYVCRTCGRMPIVNEAKGIARCTTCKRDRQSPDIYKVRTTWSTKLFMQEMESCNAGVKLGVSVPSYDATEISTPVSLSASTDSIDPDKKQPPRKSRSKLTSSTSSVSSTRSKKSAASKDAK